MASIAESLIDRGHYERAEWCLWEALRLDPAIPRLRARLGSVCAAAGRPRKALQFYLRDLRDDPGNIDTLLDYGAALVELGRYAAAGEKFRRIRELEPANVDAHYRLGELALSAGRHEQANLEFELVFKLDPQFPQIRVALAAALLRRRKTREARRLLRAQVEHLSGPGDSGEGQYDPPRFGSLLLEAGLAAEAAAVFERAVCGPQPSAELYRKLALAQFRAGDRDAGTAASRRVLRLDPKCVVSIHNLALAALDHDRLRVAAAWIRRGLEVDRHDDGLRRLRFRLWLAALAHAGRRLVGR